MLNATTYFRSASWYFSSSLALSLLSSHGLWVKNTQTATSSTSSKCHCGILYETNNILLFYSLPVFFAGSYFIPPATAINYVPWMWVWWTCCLKCSSFQDQCCWFYVPIYHQKVCTVLEFRGQELMMSSGDISLGGWSITVGLRGRIF